MPCRVVSVCLQPSASSVISDRCSSSYSDAQLSILSSLALPLLFSPSNFLVVRMYSSFHCLMTYPKKIGLTSVLHSIFFLVNYFQDILTALFICPLCSHLAFSYFLLVCWLPMICICTLELAQCVYSCWISYHLHSESLLQCASSTLHLTLYL